MMQRKNSFLSLRRLPWTPSIIILLFVFAALLAPLLSPAGPLDQSIMDRMKPPFWQEGGNGNHILGTDQLGRDVLSRVIFGAKVSLQMSALALLLGAGIGTTIGLVAAYKGGLVDAVLMRACDATIGFPIILLALLLVVTLGPGPLNVVIAIAMVIWARFARMIRNEAASVMTRDFIAQARVAGCSTSRIIIHYLFPNVLNTLMVLVSLQVGWVILVEATLSFLGAGVPPPTPTWGNMVADGRTVLTRAWWIATFPSIAIMLITLSFNLFGDWLRDRLDPKLRQV